MNKCFRGKEAVACFTLVHVVVSVVIVSAKIKYQSGILKYRLMFYRLFEFVVKLAFETCTKRPNQQRHTA